MDAPDDPLFLAEALGRMEALAQTATRGLSALDGGMLLWNLLLALALLSSGSERGLLLLAGLPGNLTWFFLRRRYRDLLTAKRAVFRAFGVEGEEERRGGELCSAPLFLDHFPPAIGQSLTPF